MFNVSLGGMEKMGMILETYLLFFAFFFCFSSQVALTLLRSETEKKGFYYESEKQNFGVKTNMHRLYELFTLAEQEMSLWIVWLLNFTIGRFMGLLLCS